MAQVVMPNLCTGSSSSSSSSSSALACLSRCALPYPHHRFSISFPQLFSSPFSSTCASSIHCRSSNSRSRLAPLFCSLPPSPPPPSPSSSHFDENGAVRDMELYLNDLSLEYESVWDTKPAWCQPWTIVLTGSVTILMSWLVLHSVMVTGIVTSAIGVWWFIFLYSYPQAYTEMIAERRKKVREGDEDTYGSKR